MNLGMRWRISSEVIDQIMRDAMQSAPLEACGLLFGAPGLVSGAIRCRNVAATPLTTFEIDPQQLIESHRAARQGGPAVVGCYHSHPGGDPAPSATDAAMAAADGSIWLIVGGWRMGAWLAVAGGERHGRFDPVEIGAAPRDL